MLCVRITTNTDAIVSSSVQGKTFKIKDIFFSWHFIMVKVYIYFIQELIITLHDVRNIVDAMCWFTVGVLGNLDMVDLGSLHLVDGVWIQ
jgi:hypothetical protein